MMLKFAVMRGGCFPGVVGLLRPKSFLPISLNNGFS